MKFEVICHQGNDHYSHDITADNFEINEGYLTFYDRKEDGLYRFVATFNVGKWSSVERLD
jgi:hypothetical protein